MKKYKKLFIKLGISIMRIIYALLKALPIQQKIVFISKLSRNTPLDFLILSEAIQNRFPQYKIVFLCQPIGNKLLYAFHVLAQMYHLATSKVVFLDRSCMAVHVLKHRKDTQIIQLWHALGCMKKFGYAILNTEEGQTEEMAELFHMHEGYTAILISSFSFIKDFEEGFHASKSAIVEIPLPRVDMLLDEKNREKKRQEFYRSYPSFKNKKIILYSPTYRKNEAAFHREKMLQLVDSIDQSKYYIIYCPHPLSNIHLEDDRVIEYSAFAQDVLYVADAVISDYSSIIYEAGLMGLPVFLYTYDWQEYRRSRSHNLDLENDIPAVFSEDATRIVKAVEKDEFDQLAFRSFIEDNITLPQGKTCCNAIIDFLDL